MQYFAEHDLTGISGRVLVAGDVHGHFTLLRETLSTMEYDPQSDVLILLGDLVNRGPESEEAIDWAGYLRVLGNHEAATVQAATIGLPDEVQERMGGRWFLDMDAAERRRYSAILGKAPIAMQVRTPAGHEVGLVHADVPYCDWAYLRTVLETGPSHPEFQGMSGAALWKRTMIDGIREGRPISAVKGVDHVFLGHTIVAQPFRHENCTWMDIGSYRSRRIAVVDVDAWLS